MNILGLSAFFHESACCLLQGGRLVAAAEEERFSRVKHDPRLPVSAFRWCLKQGGIGLVDLDAVAFYESPVAKVSRQIWAGTAGGAARSRAAGAGDPRGPGMGGPHPHLLPSSLARRQRVLLLRLPRCRGIHRRRRRRMGHHDVWPGRRHRDRSLRVGRLPHSLGLLYLHDHVLPRLRRQRPASTR